ncbi:MAG: cytochrome c [Burkholderiales bacterium]
MKSPFIIAALVFAFAAPSFADGSSSNEGGMIQTTTKKKQKGKPKAAPVAAAAAGTTAAATGAATEAAKPASEDTKPTAEVPKPAAAGNVVKTDLYTVSDGTRVDAKTLDGFKIWRAAACDRCHGANQEGMVGPSLLDSLKKLSKDEFVKTLKEGRLEKGMPPWNTNEQVMKGMDNLYAYLKGRSDGAITKAKVQAME